MRARWVNPTNNRYYNAYVGKDLFGKWVLTLTWGGKMKKGGAIKHLPFDSFFNVLLKISEIDKTRSKHGYR